MTLSPQHYSESWAMEDNNANEDSEDDMDSDPTEPVDVYTTLSEGQSTSENDYSLPPHQQCGCHMLNLIAMTDAEKPRPMQLTRKFTEQCLQSAMHCVTNEGARQRLLKR